MATKCVKPHSQRQCTRKCHVKNFTFSSIFFVFQLFSTWALLFFFLHIFYIIRRPRHNHFQSIGYKNTSLVFSLSPELHFCFVLYQYCNHKVETKLVQYQHIGWDLDGPVLAGWAIGWADGSNIIVIFCGVCKQQFFLSFLFS